MANLPAGFRFSQSALADEQRCPRRFWLRYLRRLDWPGPAAGSSALEEAAGRGKLFHQWVEQEALGMDVGQSVHLSGDPHLAQWWANWQASPPPGVSQGKVYSEIELAVPFAGFRLVAKFDRVVVGPDGGYRVFDWKTGGGQEQDFAASWQTTVYLYVIAEAGGVLGDGQRPGPSRVSLSYWHAERPDAPLYIDYDDQRHAQAQQRLNQAIQAIAARRGLADFAETDDRGHCRRCSFRSYCDHEQQGDGQWEFSDEEFDWLNDTWDELEEDGRVD
jgi:RecB family exonuclease